MGENFFWFAEKWITRMWVTLVWMAGKAGGWGGEVMEIVAMAVRT